MLVMIVDQMKKDREALTTLDYHESSIKKLSRRELELESGNRVVIKPPRADAIRGWKPDLLILRCSVSDNFYHRILEPCVGRHGMILDERT